MYRVKAAYHVTREQGIVRLPLCQQTASSDGTDIAPNLILARVGLQVHWRGLCISAGERHPQPHGPVTGQLRQARLCAPQSHARDQAPDANQLVQQVQREGEGRWVYMGGIF